MHPTKQDPAATPLLRALIVDDEAPGRYNLRYMLAAHSGWEVAGECASAAEARALLATCGVDVVFLDIRMPRESGLDLARSLCAAAEPPLIIFVTSFNGYAVDAFELHALDYLLKPFDARRLQQALARAEQMLALRQRGPYRDAVRGYLDAQAPSGADNPAPYLQQLTVRSVGKIEWIRIDEVHWVSAANNYVELHTATRAILHRLPLSKLEEGLDPQVFQRVHRRAIVRIDQFKALSVVGDGSYSLLLRCGAEVAVSERYVDAVRTRCAQRCNGAKVA
jgi:two-component system LytT family response regulator